MDITRSATRRGSWSFELPKLLLECAHLEVQQRQAVRIWKGSELQRLGHVVGWL